MESEGDLPVEGELLGEQSRWVDHRRSRGLNPTWKESAHFFNDFLEATARPLHSVLVMQLWSSA